MNALQYNNEFLALASKLDRYEISHKQYSEHKNELDYRYINSADADPMFKEQLLDKANAVKKKTQTRAEAEAHMEEVKTLILAQRSAKLK